MKKMYLGENYHAVIDAVTVAAISGRPLLLFGPPGVGKSDPAFLAAEAFCGGDRTKLWHRTMGPGTPPAEISGALDVSRMVNENVVAYTTAGTPYQQQIIAVIIDEITRANRAAIDSLLPILSDAYPQRRGPTLRIATTNFGITDPDIFESSQIEHNRALADRFAHVLIIGYEPPHNVADALDAYATRTVMNNGRAWRFAFVPDYQEVDAFHALIRLTPDALALGGTPLNRVIADALKILDEGNRSMRRQTSFTRSVLLTHWYEAWKQASMSEWADAKDAALTAYASNNPDEAQAIWRRYAQRVQKTIVDAARSIPLGALTETALQISVYLEDGDASRRWKEHVLSLIPGRNLPAGFSPSDFVQTVYETAVRYALGDMKAEALLTNEIAEAQKQLKSCQSHYAAVLRAYPAVCMYFARNGAGHLQELNELKIDQWPPPRSIIERILRVHDQIGAERHPPMRTTRRS
ncbi:AAA family ATPase [Roseiflexus castenholzii]|uniref:AAA family ATPase n=1 Tax=Roseiflexus castenholzii TaxID=120962 RepID=UPI003C7DC21C